MFHHFTGTTPSTWYSFALPPMEYEKYKQFLHDYLIVWCFLWSGGKNSSIFYQIMTKWTLMPRNISNIPPLGLCGSKRTAWPCLLHQRPPSWILSDPHRLFLSFSRNYIMSWTITASTALIFTFKETKTDSGRRILDFLVVRRLHVCYMSVRVSQCVSRHFNSRPLTSHRSHELR